MPKTKKPTREQLERELAEARGKIAALEAANKNLLAVVVDLAMKPVTVPTLVPVAPPPPFIPHIPHIPMPGERWPGVAPPWMPPPWGEITCEGSCDVVPVTVDDGRVAPLTVDGSAVAPLTVGDKEGIVPLTVDGGVAPLTVGDPRVIPLTVGGANPNICTGTTTAPFPPVGHSVSHLTITSDPKLWANMSATSAPSIPPEFVNGSGTWTSSKYGASAASGCGNPGFGTFIRTSSDSPGVH